MLDVILIDRSWVFGIVVDDSGLKIDLCDLPECVEQKLNLLDQWKCVEEVRPLGKDQSRKLDEEHFESIEIQGVELAVIWLGVGGELSGHEFHLSISH